MINISLSEVAALLLDMLVFPFTHHQPSMHCTVEKNIDLGEKCNKGYVIAEVIEFLLIPKAHFYTNRTVPTYLCQYFQPKEDPLNYLFYIFF